jgi:hypothetical protein
MIAINRLKRAIADVSTAGMQTGKYQVKLDKSDAERIVLEFDALAAQVEQLRKGVTHFNRSRGDMNPLLTAYVNTPAQCLAEVKAQAVEQFIEFYWRNDDAFISLNQAKVAYLGSLRGKAKVGE